MSRRHTRVYLALGWHEPGHLAGINCYASETNWVLDRYATGFPVETLRRFRPHGIICQLYKGTPDLVKAVEEAHLPTVELADSIPTMRVPRVLPDGEAEGARAAAHLLERGFSRFVCFVVAGTRHAFVDVVREAGHEVHLVSLEELECETGRSASRYGLYHDLYSDRRCAWARRFFSVCEKPVGVYVQSMLWAASIIEGCRAARIAVPEQVAVIGSADTPDEGMALPVPITTVVPNYEEQGYQAAALLDRMLHGAPMPPDTVVKIPPLALVPRISTMCHATTDLNLARAATYIMRNLHDVNLCSKQVQRVTKQSHSAFYRNFIHQFKMPVARYIEHLRINEAVNLLETTDREVGSIAVYCGFGDVLRFRRAFVRAKGMPPSAWRKQPVGEKVHTGERVKIHGEGWRQQHDVAASNGREDEKNSDRTPARWLVPRRARAGIAPFSQPHSMHTAGKVESMVESSVAGAVRVVPDRLICALDAGPLSKQNMARAIGRVKPDGQIHSAVNDLLTSGLIERTIPDKPNSRLQKYRLTEKGRRQLMEGTKV